MMARASQRKRLEKDKNDGSEPAQVNSARRQEVIDAAAAIFARSGYHGVSTRALADELGIKVASLYFHLRSKDHALEEVCQRGVDQPLEFLDSTLRQPPVLADRIRHYFSLVHDQMVHEADYMTVMMNDVQHLNDEARREIDRKLLKLRKGFVRMFEEAQQAGELVEGLSPRSASFIMVGTIRNLTHLYAAGPIRDFDALMKDAVEALIRAVHKP